MDDQIRQQAENHVRENLHDVIPRHVFESRVQEQAQALLKEKVNYGSQSGSTAA